MRKGRAIDVVVVVVVVVVVLLLLLLRRRRRWRLLPLLLFRWREASACDTTPT
jgi:hypothetical protein